MMFCVECGKEGPIHKNGVCEQCYIQSTQFTKGPNIIDIFVCPKCSAYKYKNIWYQEAFQEALQRHLRNHFKISQELSKTTITPTCTESKKIMLCTITVSGYIGNTQVSEHHDIQLRLKHTVCDVCSKKYGGYYEAILQIRSEKRKLSEHQTQAIHSSVEYFVVAQQKKGNRAFFITDIAEEHGGLDFYLSEKGTAYSLVKKLQEEHGGEIKKSSKNIGMKDSKQVYRMTYLLRLPSYKKHDVIFYNNTYYLIIALSGRKIHVIDLVTWDERIFYSKEVQKLKIIDITKKVNDMIVVSQTNKEIQLMDTKTYKNWEISKPKQISIEEKTIPIIKIDNHLFLFPKKS